MISAFLVRVAGNLRDAVRQLRADRAYSAILIVTMTIGIAAASAIFSVVRGVILRPLPYRQPDALVSVQEYQPAARRDQTAMSVAAFADLRASSTSFEGLSAFSNSEFVLSDGNAAERVIVATVDAALFPLLGTSPALGRVFENAEVGESPARVAIMAHGLWQRRYGGDRAIIGRSIVVDGNPFTVVGVMPARFEFPRNSAMDRDIELWTPRRVSPAMMMRRGMRTMTVIGRLRRDVSDVAVRAELDATGRRFAQADPAAAGWSLRVVPLREMIVGGVRQPLLTAFACVIALLVIVCVNVSSAALARIVSRRHALGVRVALGASSGALRELLFSESVFLALMAGVLALPSSALVRAILLRIAPVAIPRQGGIESDLMAVLFTLAVAVVVGTVAALAPTLWLRRLDVRAILMDSGHAASSSRFIRQALGGFVVVQLALGTILLGATTELYSTYASLSHIDPGFRSAGVTTASIALRGARYQNTQARVALTEQLLDRIRSLPGVEHAAVGSLGPLSGGMMTGGYRVLGIDSDSARTAALRAVSADFFATLGVPVREGRTIGRGDGADAPLVVVVNQSFVRQAFAGRSPIGTALMLNAPGRDSTEAFQIVGVVGDAKEKDLQSPGSAIIYFSNAQASFAHTVLMVHAAGEPPIAAIRGALRDLDRTLALDDVGGLTAKVRASYALQAFLLIVVAAFAANGAILIGIGVYGAAAFAVTAELRSIGVRVALGASPGMMVRQVIGRTARLAAIGSAAGALVLTVAPAFNPVLALGGASRFFGPAIAASIVVAIATIATLLPARRAGLADPAELLRN